MDTTNPKDCIGVTKPQLNLVPPALLIWTAKAMENGAAKYGPFNWRDKKVKMTIYVAAAMRHLLSLLDGEDTAQDSGLPHASHAAACMGILLDAKECGCLIDDRPKIGCASELIERLAIKKTPKTKDTPRRIRVYLGGPMRGIKDFNFPAFFKAEEQLQARGYEVFNPARHDENRYGAGALKTETGSEEEVTTNAGFSIREALYEDCAWITQRAEYLVLMPGWESSTGCRAEHALAIALRLKILTLEEALFFPSAAHPV